jgi:copper resistance protein B
MQGLLVLAGFFALAARADGLPPVTEAEHAAAFPDVSGTDLHAHMNHDPLTAMLLAEQFEWQDGSASDALQWDVTGWVGYDMNRLWLRDEGRDADGATTENALELLWGRPLAAWWDWVAGARLDNGEGPARTYAALGVIGLAPQWFHVEATAYLGEGGQLGAHLQTDYDWLFTNRLILGARLEADAWSQDDKRVGIGSGLSQAVAGLRLRYEIRRELAPYLGVEWRGLLGETGDIAHDNGEDRNEASVVAGVRFWF